jgi:hypothetical protein
MQDGEEEGFSPGINEAYIATGDVEGMDGEPIMFNNPINMNRENEEIYTGSGSGISDEFNANVEEQLGFNDLINTNALINNTNNL